jgi:hypothetical protein
MKKFLAVVGLLAAVAAVVYFFFPELIGLGGGLVRRDVPELRCSIALPGGWKSEVRSVGTPTLLAENSSGSEHASLTMIRTQAKEDAVAFEKRHMAEEAKRRAGYGEHSRGPDKLGGRDAMRTVFSFDAGKVRRKAVQYVAVRDEYAYILCCDAAEAGFDDALGRFSVIAGGLKFE